MASRYYEATPEKCRAILGAVRHAGKIGKVGIVCFAEDDETLSGRENAIYATVVQQPLEFGFRSIEMMTKILDGDRSMIPATKQILVSDYPDQEE